jgi:hypothetical protein
MKLPRDLPCICDAHFIQINPAKEAKRDRHFIIAGFSNDRVKAVKYHRLNLTLQIFGTPNLNFPAALILFPPFREPMPLQVRQH